MGIDAEMLIRNVPSDVVTDEWLKEMSWLLCQSIGAEKFFVSDGLVPDEYERVNAAWHKAFDAHELYQTFRGSSGDARDEARKKILADIGEAPKQRRLAIEKTFTRYRDEDSPVAGSEYHEDSDEPITANPGECLLELSLLGRYYGEGYERGDILAYCAIAEWLEANIPGCEVWYGGDSSGVCARHFNEEMRSSLRRHLYSQNGRDYFASFGRYSGNDGIPKPMACSMCPGGKFCGNRNGFGGNFAAYSCGGCGKSFETRDGGKTYEQRKEQ